MNARFILLENGFETTFNKMHDDDDDDIVDDVFTSICSHSFLHLGISCPFGAKTHELNSTNPLCSSHRSHHEAEAAGGGEDVQGADR